MTTQNLEDRLEGQSTLKAIALIILSGLTLLGVYISELLIQKHIGHRLGEAIDTGVCGSQGASCAAAVGSSYGTLFGLPIAALGEAYYLCVLGVLIWARFGKKSRSACLDILGLTSLLSVLYSVVLLGLSIFVLEKICPLCASLYGVNLFSFLILVYLGHFSLRRIPSLFTQPVPWLVGLLMMCMMIGVQSGYAVRYQEQYHAKRKAIERSQKPVHHQLQVGEAPQRGELSAAVVIEFSDFQCPYCKRFMENLKQARLSAGDHSFSYAFKHFPLSTQCNPHVSRDMHPRACYAAMASICAQEQDQFWPMHDLLFEHQHELMDEDLKGYAETLKLDLDAFIECLNSERAQKRLSSDIEEGDRLGIRGTPVFLVNGWLFKGAKHPETILEAVKKYAYGELDEEEEEHEE